MFDRLLIANRGEIACRIIRTARHLGIHTIAVFSEADRDAKHVSMASEGTCIGPAEASESYLNIDRILEVANNRNADAIHPGYGFLAENPSFARAVAEGNLIFVGPSAETIEAMGQKDRAKDLMEEAGVPVVPGYRGENQDPDTLEKEAKQIGFPLLIKALSGGGGKGMRRVDEEKQFRTALESCRREAQSSFGDERILLEKYIEQPRHIEVQVFGDHHDSGVHLFERDCSLQRRYQKVVEESPAPGLTEGFRNRLFEAALRAVDALSYRNAGTLEFIADAKGGIDAESNFYFMEMNTRLQVEHPVTEMITGEDLVEWQLRVADGQTLPLEQNEISRKGHAFEARLYAEDPSNEFVPQGGQIKDIHHPPTGDHLRIDSGVRAGDTVGIHYDPMIAKMVVYGEEREDAFHRTREALLESGIVGVTTNLEFLAGVFHHEAFRKGNVDTHFISRHQTQLIPPNYGKPGVDDLLLAAVYFLSGSFQTDPRPDARFRNPWTRRDNWRLNSSLTRDLTLVSDGEEFKLTATCRDRTFAFQLPDGFDPETATVSLENRGKNQLQLVRDGTRINSRVVERPEEHAMSLVRDGRSIPFRPVIPGMKGEELGGEGKMMATMPGKIIEINYEEGDAVEKNETVLVMEAMKMEMNITAGRSGVIEQLPVTEGEQVQEGDLLVSITEHE